MIVDYVLFVLAGCLAGTMAGLLGIGGGMVIVPSLSFIFAEHMHVPPESVMHVASGSSLCAMIFTSQSSVIGHFRHGNILWSLYRKMFFFIAFGAVIGALVADMLSTYVIKKIFGGFLLVVALEMLLSRKVALKKTKMPDWITKFVSLCVGSLSGLLGIGGGTFLIPYLSRCKISTRKIAAISSLCSLTAAFVGTVAIIFTGLNENYHTAWSTGFVYWPAVIMVAIPSAIFAQLSSRWTYRLKPRYIRRFFITFLLITAVMMLV